MDWLASTGAGGATTGRELAAEIHLIQYKSAALEGQSADAALWGESLLDLGSRTDIAVERATHAPEGAIPEFDTHSNRRFGA